MGKDHHGLGREIDGGKAGGGRAGGWKRYLGGKSRPAASVWGWRNSLLVREPSLRSNLGCPHTNGWRMCDDLTITQCTRRDREFSAGIYQCWYGKTIMSLLDSTNFLDVK